MKQYIPILPRKILLASLAGLVAGVMLLSLFRFVFLESPVHHHANLAVFIDGKREKFESFTYYEEVEACAADPANNAKVRVHLHQPDSDVVHVHSGGVTWAMLFANIGLSLSDRLVETGEGVFIDKANGKQLNFMLNGEKTNIIAAKNIASEDVLLISYGDSETDLTSQYEQIKQTAGVFNKTADPAACSGRDTESVVSRFKYALLGLTRFE